MNLKSINMDLILGEYSKRRLENMRIHEQRKDEVYTAVPEIEEIDGEIRKISLDAARRSVMGEVSDAGKTEVAAKRSNLIQKKQSLLKDSGYPADYLDPVYSCKICNDTGYKDGKMCRCLSDMVVKSLYERSNLINILSVENFDNFSSEYFSKEIPSGEKVSPYDNIRRIKAAALEFVDNFDKKPKGLLFSGSVGTGKTYLSNCIAKALLDKGYSVFYVTAIELFEICSNYIRNRSGENVSRFYNLVFDSELLIIDDLGTETINSFVQSNFFEIINQRMLRNRSTVISTNSDLAELKDRYTDRTISRIMGNYKLFRFYGSNIRFSKINH